MEYTYDILRTPYVNMGGSKMAIWDRNAERVDGGTMTGGTASEWRKALNRLAFRSDSRSSSVAAGAYEYRLVFRGPKPRGAKSQTLTRASW